MNKYIYGKFESDGDGVCTAKIYTKNGYYKGTITVSNGGAFDSQPSDTLISKKVGKKSNGVKTLTSIGYINVPEYELYETQAWDNVQDEVMHVREYAQEYFTTCHDYDAWLRLFDSHEEYNVNLAFQILHGLQQEKQNQLNQLTPNLKKCKR